VGTIWKTRGEFALQSLNLVIYVLNLRIFLFVVYVCRRWFSVCEECTHALFAIHPAPEKLVAAIIARQYSSLGPYSVPPPPNASNLLAPVCRLARLLFLVGQAAVCTLVLLEKAGKDAKKSNERNRVTASTGSTEGKGVGGGEAQRVEDECGAMEEEMGMAAAVDAEHDKVRLLVCFRCIISLHNMHFVCMCSPVCCRRCTNILRNTSSSIIRSTSLGSSTRWFHS